MRKWLYIMITYIYMYVNEYERTCKGIYDSSSGEIEAAELGKAIIRCPSKTFTRKMYSCIV